MCIREQCQLRRDVVDHTALVMSLGPLGHAAVAAVELTVIIVGETSQDLHHHRTHLETAFRQHRPDDLLAEDSLPGLRQTARPDGHGVLVLLLIPGAAFSLDSAELLPKFIKARRDVFRLPGVLRGAGSWFALVRPAPHDRPLRDRGAPGSGLALDVCHCLLYTSDAAD